MHATLTARMRKDELDLEDGQAPAAKRLRGEDIIRVFEITAAAAQHPDNPLLQQVLDEMRGIKAEMRGIKAALANARRRKYNKHAASLYPGVNVALRPLFKEQSAAGGGAAAGGGVAVGAPPADGVFPATCKEMHELSAAKLNALQTFYGEEFAGTAAERRSAFIAFATQ